MKKILSLVLSAVLVMASFLTISAATDTVDVSYNAYDITVTVKTETEGGVTLKVFPSSGNVPVYIGQANENEFVKGTTYTYDINVEFKYDAPTGNYRAVTNRGEKTFYYVNPVERVAFYKDLDLVNDTKETITSKITAAVNAGTVENPGNYSSYTTEKDLISEQLINLADLPEDSAAPDALSMGYTIDDVATYKEKAEAYVKGFEDAFFTKFEKLLAIADLDRSSASNFDAQVTANGETIGLDTSYYNEVNDPALVHRFFNNLTASSYSDTEINDMFDEAVLLAVINKTADSQKITDALKYYDNNLNSTCITLYTDSTKTVTEAQYNEISGKIKTANNDTPILTAAALETAYEAAFREVVGDGTGSDDTTEDGDTDSGSPGPAPAGGGGGPTEEKPKDPEEPENPGTQSGTLSDLHEAAWAQKPIEALVEKGVLAGKGDGKFYPNDTVTREEFIKIIAEAFEITDESADAEFSDVDSNRWSYKYIASGYSAGIISGISESEFNPGGQMSRQDMAVMIFRAAQYLGYELSDDDGADFADITDVSDYAKEAVKALCAAGVINGTGNNMFSPKNIVTRAQAAKIVYELLAQMGGIK